MLVNECKKYNINLIDTKGGKDRNRILKQLLNNILKQ